MSLFRCCAGSRRQNIAEPAKVSKRPGSQPNGQQGNDVTSGQQGGLIRTPSLHNYALTSSDDHRAPRSARNTERPGATTGSTESRTVSTRTGTVGFPPSSGKTQPGNSSSSASPVTDVDATYFPGDYDNAGNDGEDRKQLATTTHQATATEARTPIKSTEEESLDHLVAHLLEAVTHGAAVTSGQAPATNNDLRDEDVRQPTTTDPAPSSSLHWPQGDSLPRVEMRSSRHDYDVPKPGTKPVDSGKLLTAKHISADENDNTVKSLEVDFDTTATPAEVPSTLPPTVVQPTPPLCTARKKLTPSTNCEVVSAGDDVVSPADSKPSTEILPKCAEVARNGRSEKDYQSFPVKSNPECEATSDRTDVNLSSGQQSAGQVEHANSDVHPGMDSSVADSHGSVNIVSAKNNEAGQVTVDLSTEVQQTSLLEQFKALRLEVLTSTSQLLSCVSGTWKRGESFRSKLTTIVQLCMELQTSIGKLQAFLQSTLSKSAATAAGNTIVETASTRIRNLDAVQTSIDAFMETLDGENVSGTERRDLKVGGIIHLTKEIPGLVRTFAPVVEYLSTRTSVASQRNSDISVTESQHSDAGDDGTEVFREKPADPISHSKQTGVRKISADAEDAAIKLFVMQDNITAVSDTSKFSRIQTESNPAATDHVQELQTAQVSTLAAAEVPYSDAKNTLTESSSDRNNARDTGVQLLKPVLPSKADTPPAPTPPPKVRVATGYQANLGITDSSTSVPTTSPERDDASNMTATVLHNIATVSVERLEQAQRQLDSGTAAAGTSQAALIAPDINYVSGCQEDIVAADKAQFRFPRASETASSQQSAVVLRRPVNQHEVQDLENRRCRVSESELETPDFRASGVSQTMVDQLEALQTQAKAQVVITHTDIAAGYERFDAVTSTRQPNLYYQSTLTAEDRRLLMFYCDQMTGHWNVLDNAASAFFHCMDRRQPPKVFVSHSKFVIVAGHKMAYLGDVLARNLHDDNAQDWIVAHSNRLCNSLKQAVRTTKEAALAYPGVPALQLMVDCIKDVTDWAIELKEVVDRLAYLGRPDHVLA